MGWWSEPDSASERSARLNGQNADRNHQNARTRDDINFLRRQEADYDKKNWDHKKMAFEAEQRLAARENRVPRFMSPAAVPDMPRPYQPPRHVPVQQEEQGGDFSWLGILAVGCVVVFFVIPAILSMIAPVLQAAFQIIGTVLMVGAAGLTLTWLVMHFTAKDDPARIHRAKLWNPIRIGRVLWRFGSELLAARRARKTEQ